MSRVQIPSAAPFSLRVVALPCASVRDVRGIRDPARDPPDEPRSCKEVQGSDGGRDEQGEQVEYSGRERKKELMPDKIQVFRLDAARRRLEAGVRLFFAYGDAVAIHTLVSAGR